MNRKKYRTMTKKYKMENSQDGNEKNKSSTTIYVK